LEFNEQQDTLPRVSLRGLEERLSKSPEPISVLHVLCHGASLETKESGVYGLVWNSSLEGQDKELVDGAKLGALLAPYADTLKLVVLCACHSGDSGKMASYLGSVAQEVHRAGIEVVVASRLPLSATGSVLMTETLYQKLLGENCSLEESLGAARRKLRVAGSGFDWAALQFYAHRAQPLFLGQRKPQEKPRVLTLEAPRVLTLEAPRMLTQLAAAIAERGNRLIGRMAAPSPCQARQSGERSRCDVELRLKF